MVVNDCVEEMMMMMMMMMMMVVVMMMMMMKGARKGVKWFSVGMI